MPKNSRRAPLAGFIGEYRERTARDPFLKPATKHRREIAVKALLKTWPDLARRDARKITRADCQRWGASALAKGTGFIAPRAKTRRSGMSASAFNKCVDALRAILDLACEDGVARENPAKGLRKAPMRRKRLELPSVTQFHAIVKSVAGAGARQSRDCADMVRLLAYSGARLKEATALRWRDVDVAHNRMTVAGTKSESSDRIIPIFRPLAGLLAEIRRRRGEEPADAPILRIHECKGALRSACLAVGVKRLTHHDLRHLFATCCIESGVDIPTVSRWLGHADGGNLAMRTYGHLRQEHSIAQARKVRF
jgi:integrase